MFKTKIMSGSVLAACIVFFLNPLSVFARYDIRINYIVNNPAMFPVGPLVPGDLSDASEIEFADIQPFFIMNVTGDGPEELRVLVRFESENGILFTVSSTVFPIRDIYGRPMNNRDLATVPSLHFGSGTEQVNANRLLPFISGDMLREGTYTLTLVMSEHDNWNDAIEDNHGLGNISVWAQNINQVNLQQPFDNSTIQNNPIFQWSFPRRAGVVFHFELNSGIQSYADIEIEVPPNEIFSDITTLAYTGTGDQRPLDPNESYFWSVTATVPTMFQELQEEVPSPTYTFTYEPPGGGDNPGGDIGGDYEDQPGGDEDLGLSDIEDEEEEENRDSGHARGGTGLSGGPLGDSGNEGDPPPEDKRWAL